jgi:hypothetical protein
MMFKNKNYVKSRFTVLATGVFLSMLITAPQSQAAFSFALKCNASTGVATVSKPTASMLSADLQFNWYGSQKNPLGATSGLLNETTGQILAAIYDSAKYVSVYPDSRGGFSGLVACR